MKPSVTAVISTGFIARFNLTQQKTSGELPGCFLWRDVVEDVRTALKQSKNIFIFQVCVNLPNSLLKMNLEGEQIGKFIICSASFTSPRELRPPSG